MVNAMRCMPALILTAVLLLTAGCSTKSENLQSAQTVMNPTTEAIYSPAANPPARSSSNPTPTPEAIKPTPAPTEKETLVQSIRNKSRLVIDAIKSKDMIQLAAYTHPDLGVRLSSKRSVS
jgi:hypothetical protein